MYLFSVFEHSYKLEAALTALEMKGISKDAILAVPLDRRNEGRMLFDTVNSSDNTSVLALPIILAMLGTMLGSTLGFELEWGPILWGFMGAVIGVSLGLVLSLLATKNHIRHQNGHTKTDVVIIIHCETGQADMVQDTLWANAAMGVSRLSL